MRVTHLWLTDFRNYPSAELAPAPGLTVVLGDNGAGKTSLLEAIGYLASLSSFRGVPNEAMVRTGCARAVLRAECDASGRRVLLEAELPVSGRGRLAVNRQPLRRARDLLGVVRVTVFSPDDLALVKGAPAGRRRYLDDLLVALHPKNDALIGDLERVLRQRNTLLRQAGGVLRADVATTLDVWDAQLVVAGESLGAARQAVVDRLQPILVAACRDLDVPRQENGNHQADIQYEAPWRTAGLAQSLLAGRQEDLRRGVTLVGPHHDELVLTLDARPARTHASQGEQRTVALALRLASHALVAETTGETPVLLLDDVFSELDPARSQALLDHLPVAQAVLTTAGAIPDGARPELVVRVGEGRLEPAVAGSK